MGRVRTNAHLTQAKRAKNDEFYTQYADIAAEIDAYVAHDPDVFRGKTVLCPCDDPEWSNFTKFFVDRFEELGLARLISTCYAPKAHSKEDHYPFYPLFGDGPAYEEDPALSRGRILDVTSENIAGLDSSALPWELLEGDGDFRSREVTALRDQADFVITNPPFSLIRQLLKWLKAGRARFAVVGTAHMLANKEAFAELVAGRLWVGASVRSESVGFVTPGAEGLSKIGTICWITSVDHALRATPSTLSTMAENIASGRHPELAGGYPRYVNLDALEVPWLDAVPSDYDGVMGVPVTFLARGDVSRFEVLGTSSNLEQMAALGMQPLDLDFVRAYRLAGGKSPVKVGLRALALADPKPRLSYARVFIRRRSEAGQ